MKKAIAILLTALLLLTVFVSCEGDVEDLFGDNITITFDGNGSTGGQMAALKVARGKEVRLTANAYEKTDSEFTGWNTKADGSGYKYKDEQFVYFEEDTTLYAQWGDVGVTVTFNANDGSGTMNPVKVSADVYKLPENSFTAPEGCAFVRWSETAEGEVEYEVDDELEVTEDVTLYAIWAQVLSANPGEINGRYTITANTDINNRFGASGTLKLYLPDDLTLNAKKGITVTDGNTLVIDKVGTKGNGTLLIDDVGSNFAGIGGGINQAGGIITINGGTVTANCGYGGAGIGGGGGGAGGIITINGGTVTATGGYRAAGIGGGDSGVGGTISISGGTVTATGGEHAAGIGGGYNVAGGTISISGGDVEANGSDGAGIGGGCNGAGGNITIKGGTVTANGVYGGAGIGGGYYGAGGNITIKGGTVTANGGEYAAGIGDGAYSSSHGTLKIGAGCALTGGSASADTLLLGPVDSETTYTGASHPRYMNVSTVSEIKDSTSAITLKSGVYTTDKTDTEVTVSERITVEGSVFLLLPDGKKLTASEGITVSSGNTLVIDKYGSTATGTGILNATGPDNSAGIGGVDGNGGTVTINGGTVTATGGEDAAGIGGGEGGNGGTVTINGGTVTATGGVNAAGIGGGVNGNGGTVTINGGIVTANGGGYAAGIGGGVEGDGGTVTINGGTVTATGGDNTEAGIGAGTNSSSHGALTIGTGMALYGDSTSPAQTKISDATESYTGDRYRYMLAKQPSI